MHIEIINAIEQLSKEKGIDAEVIFQAIEYSIVSAYRKNFGNLHNVIVDLNRSTGECKVFAQKLVVEEVCDQREEIELGAARAIDSALNLGDYVNIEVTPKDFGRIAAQNAKQIVVQRIREAERNLVFTEYQERENDIVKGKIQRVEPKTVYIELGKAEAILTQNEQINSEKYVSGNKICAYVLEVRKTSKGPQIMVSRTHPGLVKCLLEIEVPEIKDGVVVIKSIAREAGSRSKIAVASQDENVDPVGTCVGQRGNRVSTIVEELRGEKLDIIKYSENPEEYIASALSPAKPILVEIIDEKEKNSRVVVPDSQLSLAIGKEGQNARLAAKLTGWKIDIKSEQQAKTEGILG